MDIDEWSAKECGIFYYKNGDSIVTYNDLDDFEEQQIFTDVLETCSVLNCADMIRTSGMEWNYKDPRCREIIRERFKIWTTYGNIGTDKSGWITSSAYDSMNNHYGKTIAEAECKCIEAIYATEDNK